METTAKPKVKVTLLNENGKDRFALVTLSERLAYITESYKKTSWKGNRARIVSVYIGFGSLESARAFAARYAGYRLEIRISKRLKTPYEVKINGLLIEQIIKIADRLLPIPPTPRWTFNPFEAMNRGMSRNDAMDVVHSTTSYREYFKNRDEVEARCKQIADSLSLRREQQYNDARASLGF